jgi:hypothetical protein
MVEEGAVNNHQTISEPNERTNERKAEANSGIRIEWGSECGFPYEYY